VDPGAAQHSCRLGDSPRPRADLSGLFTLVGGATVPPTSKCLYQYELKVLFILRHEDCKLSVTKSSWALARQNSPPVKRRRASREGESSHWWVKVSIVVGYTLGTLKNPRSWIPASFQQFPSPEGGLRRVKSCLRLAPYDAAPQFFDKGEANESIDA
jgi:hypothetical protein